MKREIKHCWCGAIAEGSTDFCASHNSENRRNERAAKKTQVVRQAQKVTLKRQTQLNEYHKLAKEYLIAFPCCEVEGCHLKSVEIHHIGGRENEHLTDTNKFMAVCRKHHENIHDNPVEAKEKGYKTTRSI